MSHQTTRLPPHTPADIARARANSRLLIAWIAIGFTALVAGHVANNWITELAASAAIPTAATGP
jgi:hypothetical protein